MKSICVCANNSEKTLLYIVYIHYASNNNNDIIYMGILQIIWYSFLRKILTICINDMHYADYYLYNSNNNTIVIILIKIL